MLEEGSARGGPSRVHPFASARRSSIACLRPTARGIAVAALAFVLLVLDVMTRRSGLLLFFVVLAGPLAVAPVLALSRAHRARAAGIRIMVAPPVVPVGSPCELMLQLSNEGETTLPLLCLEGPAEHSRPEIGHPRGGAARAPMPPSTSLAASPGRLLRWESLGAHRSSSTVLNVSTRRRGVFVIGPLRLWAHDPFGLFGVPVAVASPVRVVVHPPCAPSRDVLLQPDGSTPTAVPTAAEALVHSDDPAGEWNGLRPYVPGDRLHLLSWPAEALYGALLVHEFQPDGTARIRVVLDDRAGVHRRQAFEAALSTVHALMVVAAEQGFDIELVTLSGDESIGPSSPEVMVEHLTLLASAQPRKETAGSRWAVPNPAVMAPSVVVTTSTAHPTLPSLPGGPTVVVVE